MRWLLFFIIALLSACSAPKKAPPPPILRLAFHSSPAILDPRKANDFISSTLISLLYEGLTRCNPDGSVEPALADGLTISPDGLVYTFTLRPSFWSNGRPVTAFDFERSWKEILTPSFGCASTYLLFPIKNAEACSKGESALEEVGIQALGERTLRVELERPTPYFLSLTAFPLFLPAPGASEVYNGPFRIKTHKLDGEIRLVKNPSFWNPKQTEIDEIRIQIVPDENTTLEMFERGEIDWLGAPLAPLPPDSLASLGSRIQFIPMAASTFVVFNTETFLFQNPKLRRALTLCLDRKGIVSEITSGQIPAERILPPSLFGRPLPSLLNPADREAARVLFEEALAELGASRADLESLTLYFKATMGDKRLAQALQRQWKETLGLSCQIEQLDPKTHLDRLHRRGFQIALGSWISQFHDPINILERYRLRSNQKNFAGWENPRYQALLEQAASELDSEKRLNLLVQAEEIFASELPLFPLYHWTSPSLSNPRLKRIAVNPSGAVLFERFSLED